jgi:TetR/AcrR family transcriptional repressor of nem operon
VGSPGKGRQTRERILSTAADLIHQRGLNVTSTGDIMRASGTGKGQFYQHFASREELIMQVFEMHRRFVISQPPIESWDDLERWMLEHYRAQESFRFERGCPVGTAAYALQPDQKELRTEIGETFSAVRRNIARFLRRERSAGRLRSNAKVERLADFAIATVQGGLLLGLLFQRGAPVQAAIQEAFAHLRSFEIDPYRASTT